MGRTFGRRAASSPLSKLSAVCAVILLHLCRPGFFYSSQEKKKKKIFPFLSFWTANQVTFGFDHNFLHNKLQQTFAYCNLPCPPLQTIRILLLPNAPPWDFFFFFFPSGRLGFNSLFFRHRMNTSLFVRFFFSRTSNTNFTQHYLFDSRGTY